MSRHQFKLLVVLNQLLVLAAMIVYEVTDRSLPPELREYLPIDESVFNTQIGSVTSRSDLPYWVGILVIVSGLLSSLGLCLEKKWGRTLYVLTFATALVITPFTEFYLSSGWAAFVSYAAGATEGMIIALAFFSPARRMFESSEPDTLDPGFADSES